MDAELQAMAKVLKVLKPLSGTQRLYVLASAAYHLGLNKQGTEMFFLLADRLREEPAA